MLIFGTLDDGHVTEFKRQMQKAFQKGAEDILGKIDILVLPESDIDKSLSLKGSIGYVVFDDRKLVGGAIVVIDEKEMTGELHFLYVDVEVQNKGLGKFIWNEIEKIHFDVKKWVTHTPYFDKRNIHFYINSCGFKAVEFYSEHNIDGEIPSKEDRARGTDCMFRFEKKNERCCDQ